MKDHFIKRAKPEAKPTKPEKIMIGLLHWQAWLLVV